MTWITPFDAMMSAWVTVAPLTFTMPWRALIWTFWPSTVATAHALAGEVRRGHLAGHDMIGQHGDQLGLVLRLEQRFDRALGQLREGLVGRREDGERPRTLQRVDQPRSLDRGDEGREVWVRGGDIDDIGLLGRHRGTGGNRADGGEAQENTAFHGDPLVGRKGAATRVSG